jgi:hypothetical protein
MRDVLPEPIFRAIQNHLTDVGDEAHDGWQSAKAEEDTLTGDLCGSLRKTTQVVVDEEGHEWNWNANYTKFRGRSKDAFEKISGADGIIQVEVTLPDGAKVYKGLLFQAKKMRVPATKKVILQVSNMEKMAPGGSALFEYKPDGYRALRGQDFLDEIKIRPKRLNVVDFGLGLFLGNRFLPCGAGLRGMYHDAVRELLMVPTETGDIKVTPVEIHHRVRN